MYQYSMYVLHTAASNFSSKELLKEIINANEAVASYPATNTGMFIHLFTNLYLFLFIYIKAFMEMVNMTM